MSFSGGAGTLNITVSPTTAAQPTPPAPVPAAPLAITGPMPGFHAAPAAAAAPSDNHFSQKWGDPLNADLYDSDTMRARFDYYYDSSRGNEQGGIGFSLTFKN